VLFYKSQPKEFLLTTVYVTPDHDISMVNSPTEDATYNGWTNYETWNVSLYIQNEYDLYKIACGCDTYQDFLNWSGLDGSVTPDGVSYTDSGLDIDELDEMIDELSR